MIHNLNATFFYEIWNVRIELGYDFTIKTQHLIKDRCFSACHQLQVRLYCTIHISHKEELREVTSPIWLKTSHFWSVHMPPICSSVWFCEVWEQQEDMKSCDLCDSSEHCGRLRDRSKISRSHTLLRMMWPFIWNSGCSHSERFQSTAQKTKYHSASAV